MWGFTPAMQGVMFWRRRVPGLNSTCSPRSPKAAEIKASQQSFYQPRCFLLPLNSRLVTAVNVAPTSLNSPWHEITAPALTDNTYRIFASLTSWRISIKTPLCSSGCFFAIDSGAVPAWTLTLCGNEVHSVLPEVKHFLLNFASCYVYSIKYEPADLLSCEGGLIKDIFFHPSHCSLS